MALVLELERAGYSANSITTGASVTLSGDGTNFEVSKVAIDVALDVPAETEELAQYIAFEAQQACPTAKLFKIEACASVRAAHPVHSRLRWIFSCWNGPSDAVDKVGH